MENEIKQILSDYFILNELKYKPNFYMNNDNNSYTVASRIFGSCIVAVALCSELYPDQDYCKVVKNILLSEIEKECGVKIEDYDKNDTIAQMAIDIENNFKYIDDILDSESTSTLKKFYLANNKLKTTNRKGWLLWDVSTNYIEKISEHVYGTLVLAILMNRINKNIDINKVIKMLIIHETEEIKIGDTTVFDTPIEKKEEMGHRAIKEIFKDFKNKDELISLNFEFDAKETPEAKYGFMSDKFEADSQSIAYENKGYNHMDHQENNIAYIAPGVQKIIKNGAKTVAEVWCLYDLNKFSESEGFTKALKYAIKKDI